MTVAKKKRTPNQRHYSASEWAEAEVDSFLEGEAQESDLDWHTLTDNVELTEELETAQGNFTEESVRVVEAWVEKNPELAIGLQKSDWLDSDDHIAYGAWSHRQGSGVGFWEEMTGDEYRSLLKALNDDKKWTSAGVEIESEIYNVAGEAVEKTKRESNLPPSTAIRQLKNKLLR